MLRFQILVPFIHEKKNESRMQKNDIKTSMGWRICSYSLKLATRNATGVTLRLSINMTGNYESSIPHKYC